MAAGRVARPGNTGGFSRSMVPVALLLALAVLPGGRAAFKEVQANSNFLVSYDPATSGGAKVCYRVSPARACNATTPCCLDASAAVKSVFLELPTQRSLDCTVRRELVKSIKVTLDGAALSAPRRVGKRINLRMPRAPLPSGGALLCIDASSTTCSLNDICGGLSCSLSINTVAVKKQVNGRNRRVACTVSAETKRSNFDIKLINIGSYKGLDDVFKAAAEKWESIIKVDLPDMPAGTDWSDGNLTNAVYPYTEAVDDLVIFYHVVPFDGVGGIQGGAGPLLARKDGTSLPISGEMIFDQADVEAGADPTYWGRVILHEMAHVLGIGTIWEERGCMVGCTPLTPSATNNYLCANARREFAAISGCGTDLPIETAARKGSSCAHWKEARLGSELMTPSISRGETSALSRITIGGVEDLYGANSVDYLPADT